MISKQTTNGTAVILGAGNVDDLPGLLNNGYERALLVEADPDLARQAEASTAEFSSRGVTIAVKNVVIAREAGSAMLQRFNLPRFSTTQGPTGLRTLYPGLRVTSRVEVPAANLQTLLDGLVLDADHKNMLLIDMPGLAHVIVNQLIEFEMLKAFRTIELRTGEESLFDGCPPGADIAELLVPHGFRLDKRLQPSGPDRPTWVLSMDVLRLENQALQQEIDTIKNQLVSARNEGEARRAENQQLREKLAAAEREHGVKARALGEENRSLAQQLKAAEKTHNQDNQTHRDELGTVQEQLSKAKKQVETLEREVEKLREKLADSESSVGQLRKRNEKLTTQVGQKDQVIETRDGEIAELGERLQRCNVEIARATGQIDVLRQLIPATSQT